MAKSADAFRTISEVAEWLETPAHVLRFWESKFSQVKPVKRAGGRRYYRPADMKLLGGIKKLLHEDGMTIKGVQKLLRSQGVAHVSGMSQPLGDAADDDVIVGTAQEETAPATTPEPPKPEAEPAPAVEADEADTASEPASDVAEDEAASEPDTKPTPDQEPLAAEDSAPDAPQTEEVLPEDDAPPPKGQLTFSRHSSSEGDDAQGTDAVPELPSFQYLREKDEAVRAAESASGETGAQPAEDKTDDATPALRPAAIDVPDDPSDTVDATPGILSQLAGVRRPISKETAERFKPLLAKLQDRIAS